MKGFSVGDPRAVAAGKRAGLVSGEQRRKQREKRWERFGVTGDIAAEIYQLGYEAGWRKGTHSALQKVTGRSIGFVKDGHVTPQERFWSHVQKSDGCWEWQFSVDAKGYGRFDTGEERWRAHRYAWTITNGEIPDELLVCHRCDNPKCVRPDHLFLGTHTDNMQDAKAKGRKY